MKTAPENCEACGIDLPEQHRGRPRRYCVSCSAGASRRTWRVAHRDEYNAARRTAPMELVCTYCGQTFMGRPNRLTCSQDCARRHRGELRWARARGAS